MASTYTLISSNVLSSSAASVTFSSIPSTYTDLVLRMSLRSNTSGSDANVTPAIKFNGTTAANYSRTNLRGDGSTVDSFRSDTGSGLGYLQIISGSAGDLATSNTFSSVEIYIPSYTASQNKAIGSINLYENNSATARLVAQASLWQNTAAITSIEIVRESSWDFVSGSSFYLYGIKSS